MEIIISGPADNGKQMDRQSTRHNHKNNTPSVGFLTPAVGQTDDTQEKARKLGSFFDKYFCSTVIICFIYGGFINNGF